MSEKDKQPETAPQEKPKEMGKLKVEKIPGAFSKAFEEAKKSGNKSWFEKISIFAKTFWNEIHGIESEKKEVSATAKAEVNKTLEARMATAKEATKLDAATATPDKEFYGEVLAMGVAASSEVPVEMQDALISGKDKLSKASKGEKPEDSTLNEVKALGAMGLLTITKLKAKYNDPTKFKEALDRLDKISDSSAYPLKKLLSGPVLQVFRIKIDLLGEAGNFALNKLGFGYKSDEMKLLDSFSLSTDDATKLKGLKEKPMQNEEEMAKIIKKSIFPNTSDSNIKDVMKIANKLIIEKPDHIDTQTLTDLVFKIDDKDTKRLIEILTGKKA